MNTKARTFDFMARHLALASITAVAIIAVTLFGLAESIERMAFPVVRKFEVLSVVRESPNTTLVSGMLIQLRKCQIIDLRAMSDQDKELRVEYLARPEGAEMYTRPIGLSMWGPWRVHTNGARYVMLISEHRCHWLWTVETPLASFQVTPRYVP